MQFTELGTKNEKTMVMLPGTEPVLSTITECMEMSFELWEPEMSEKHFELGAA